MKHDTVFQNEDNLWDREYNNYCRLVYRRLIFSILFPIFNVIIEIVSIRLEF